MQVFDPRLNKRVRSDNPALILAAILIKQDLCEPNDAFWESIKEMADYCDNQNGSNKKTKQWLINHDLFNKMFKSKKK